MVHDYGPGRRFASVHVEMSASADPLASHDVIDNIERHFHQAENIDLVIHYDPVVTDDDAINAMHSRILAILNEISPHLAMHDFRMVRGVSHTNLIFDVVIPQDIGMSCEEIKRRIDEQLQTPEHIYYTVITFDANYTTLPTADQLREKIKKSKRKEK